jgi:hypothetical protein
MPQHPSVSRFALIVSVAVFVLGCGPDPKLPPGPKRSVRFIGSVPSVPGRPVMPPGGELGGELLCRKGDAAYVWLETMVDNIPTPEAGVLDVDVRFSDGRGIHLRTTVSDSARHMVSIPGGYATRPDYADLAVSRQGKSLGSYRIEKLADPIRAIRADEPRMKKPRWEVVQDPRSHNLEVETVAKTLPGSFSRIRLVRTSFLDLSDQQQRDLDVFIREGVQLATSGPMPPQQEVELEETVFQYVNERFPLVMSDLEVEDVFQSPVIVVPRAITVATASGFKITVPKQRLAPMRGGKVRRSSSNLHIRADHVSAMRDLAIGRDRGGSPYQVTAERVSLNLGEYGIRELHLFPLGSTRFERTVLKFGGNSAPIRTGKLPPITFHLTLRWPKLLTTYSGIVAVRGIKKPNR